MVLVSLNICFFLTFLLHHQKVFPSIYIQSFNSAKRCLRVIKVSNRSYHQFELQTKVIMKSVEELKFSTCRQFPQICNLIYSFKNLEPETVAYDNVCDVEKNMVEKRKLSFFALHIGPWRKKRVDWKGHSLRNITMCNPVVVKYNNIDGLFEYIKRKKQYWSPSQITKNSSSWQPILSKFMT